MKRIILALSFFLYSITALADGEFELKGVKIGDSQESINLNDYECSQSVKDKDVSECRSLGHVTIANKKASIKATFYQNKVDSIIAFFSHDDFADIKEAVLIKYGKPNKEEVKTLSNAMGASFDSLNLSWFKNDVFATLIEMQGSIDTSVLAISTNASTKRFSQKRNKRNQENSKDI